MFGHKYTPEENAFFTEYVPGHSYKEIQEEFISRFKWEISISQIKGYIGNHKLNTGKTGRFVKGQESHNKGKKGLYFPGSEKGWFRKGHIPKNYRPVGSERISRDGYVEVKISDPNKWRLKHLVIWEEKNGPVPKGSCVIFLDGNKTNIDISNLQMIKRKTLVRMNQNGLFYAEPELTKIGINIAEISSTIGDVTRTRG